jgi:hypothetical protein
MVGHSSPLAILLQLVSLYVLAPTLYKVQGSEYPPKDSNVGLKHRDNHITVETDVPQHQLHSVLKLLKVPQHLHTHGTDS